MSRDDERHKYTCPSCGHPILPTDPLAILSPQERRIFDVIHKAGQAGIDSQAVRERIYNGASGGVSAQLVGVHLKNMSPKLRYLGLVVDSERAGKYGAVYTVRRVSVVAHASNGKQNGASVFDDATARKIRQDPRPVGRIAKIYGVNRRTIERIRKRETWGHVE